MLSRCSPCLFAFLCWHLTEIYPRYLVADTTFYPHPSCRVERPCIEGFGYCVHSLKAYRIKSQDCEEAHKL